MIEAYLRISQGYNKDTDECVVLPTGCGHLDEAILTDTSVTTRSELGFELHSIAKIAKLEKLRAGVRFRVEG